MTRLARWSFHAAGASMTALLMFYVTVAIFAQQSRSTETTLAVTENRVGAVESRITAIEQSHLMERLSKLETVPDQLASLQTQVWGVMGGIVLIAAGGLFQMKRGKA